MARRRGTPSFSIDFSGPFFDRDPAATVKANITSLMATIAADGERDVRGRILAAEGSMTQPTGHTARHVRGRVQSLAGRPWRATAVVSMNTTGMNRRQAIRTQAAASGIEARFHPFRRTAADIRRGARAAAKADLAKGLE